MSLNQVKGSVMCDIMGQAHAYSMGSNMNKWSGGFRETHTERKRIKKKDSCCTKKYKVFSHSFVHHIQAGIFTKNKQSYKYFNLIPKKVTYLYENRYAYVSSVFRYFFFLVGETIPSTLTVDPEPQYSIPIQHKYIGDIEKENFSHLGFCV